MNLPEDTNKKLKDFTRENCALVTVTNLLNAGIITGDEIREEYSKILLKDDRSILFDMLESWSLLNTVLKNGQVFITTDFSIN